MPRYIDFLKGQLREIVQGYGPLGLLWFDGEWEEPWTHKDGLDLYSFVRSLQPNILINNRVDKGRQGMSGVTVSNQFAGDYDTPEQEVGNFSRERPWETCMTIGRQWAWKPDDELKSVQECVRTLLQVVGGDGNFLFNVGPMPDGRIEPRQTERLLQMGSWLQEYGEGVYGTRGGPYKPGPWGASTCKGDKIYLFVWDWDKEGQLRLPSLGQEVLDFETLSEGRVQVELTDKGIQLSNSQPNEGRVASVVRLTVSGKAFDIEPRSVEPE